MMPVLLSLGQFRIYSLGFFLVLSWILWSFLFWRYLRSLAINEDRIFDAMFQTSLVTLICARLGFVVTHWELFAGNPLRILALWVQPGLSLYFGLIAAVGTLIVFALKYKIRVAHVLDGLAVSFVWSALLGMVGSLLDGSTVGIQANTLWAVRYMGYIGVRHPIQVYFSLALVGIGIFLAVMKRLSEKRKWPYGLLAMWFFLLFSASFFGVELLVEHTVYWGRLSANQWILVGIFGQSLGAFYVRGGGKERVAVAGRAFGHFIQKVIGGIYAKFSKRNTQ